jgi:two-component system sensor histidine kinase UhpB
MTTTPRTRKRSKAKAVDVPERVKELTELLHGLDATRDQERKRLSRELHDTLVSALSATKLECDWLLRTANAGEEESKRRLTRVSKSLTDAILFTRRVIDQLWPAVIEHLGVVTAINHQLSELRSRAGVDVQVNTEGDLDALPEAHALTLYRAVQETLELSTRQEPPAQVQLTLRRSGKGIELRIAQDGLARPQENHRAQFDSRMTKERVLHLGGECLLASEGHGKVQLRLFLPLPPAVPLLNV